MIDRQKYLDNYGLNVDVLFDRIDQLEEALDKLSKLGNGNVVGNSIGNEIAFRVLNSKDVIGILDEVL